MIVMHTHARAHAQNMELAQTWRPRGDLATTPLDPWALGNGDGANCGTTMFHDGASPKQTSFRLTPRSNAILHVSLLFGRRGVPFHVKGSSGRPILIEGSPASFNDCALIIYSPDYSNEIQVGATP